MSSRASFVRRVRFMEAIVVPDGHPRLPDGGRRVNVPGSPVTLVSRVRAGDRAPVLPGVDLGDDVIAAAGAVATSDCGAGGSSTGVPAARIREYGIEGDRT
jgi:maltose O-acetyltransferase